MNASAQPLPPDEKRDRMIGAILYAACVTLIALIVLLFVVQVPPALHRAIRMTPMSLSTFWIAGVMLRHSYAEDLGESPAYRNPRSRRIFAAVFTALGALPLALAALDII